MGRSSPEFGGAPDRLRGDRACTGARPARSPSITGVHSSSRPVSARSSRVLPCPRSPSSTTSWPAIRARSSCGSTVSSKPRMPGHASRPSASAASRFSRISCFDAPLAMAGGTQLADGPGQIMRWCHHSTLRLLSTSRAWAHAQAGDDRVCTRHAVEGWHLRPLGAGLATPHSGSSLPLMRSTRFARVNVGSKCANMSAFIVPNVVPGRSFIPS